MDTNLFDSPLHETRSRMTGLTDRRLNPGSARALSKWVYAGAAVSGLLWTLLWLGATWFVGVGDEAARAGNNLLGGLVRIPEWLISSAVSLQSIAGTLLLILWIVGLLAIAILAAVGRFVIGAITCRNEVTALPRES